MNAWLLLGALTAGIIGGWIYSGLKLDIGWRVTLVATAAIVLFVVGAALTGFSG